MSYKIWLQYKFLCSLLLCNKKNCSLKQHMTAAIILNSKNKLFKLLKWQIY